ncbi:MAG: DUF5013 domain-containing protein [Bacteroidales bacterium]|jgi:hypothetical protein|nr:DUF5013 domain-containing protein [Bacteroidales bacterium]
MKSFFYLIGLLFVVNFLPSCKDMESTYEDFVVPGGLIYTGKPENPSVHPGYNRVEISWIKSSDPSVTSARVFWNNYQDSVLVNIPEEGSSVNVFINDLPEKFYSFFIKTYDDEGNSSIPTEVLGTVYGEKYRSGLLNRPIVSSEMNESGKIFLEWGTADVSGGAFAVDIFYLDSNGEKVIERFDIEDETTEMDGDLDKEYFFQTAYLPDSMAIDVFYTDPEPLKIQNINITNKYLKNAKRPFLRTDDWDGSRYGILQDWIITDNVKNKPGGYGGYDNLNEGHSFGVERWSTEAAIVNGKIYQTFTLPAGNYQCVFSFGSDNPGVGNTGNDPRYIVVAAGNTLPDVENINTALASVSLVGVGTNDSRTIEFSINESTGISLGLLVNFTSTRQNIRGNQFQLFQIN